MALPPTIPTSFVPQSAAGPRRFRSDLTGAFGFFSYAVLVLVFLFAAGVFFYGRILAADRASKERDLQEKIDAIDSKTVESFVRLRNRLTSGAALLGGHVAFSSFFSALEKIIPTTIRFSSLRLSIDTIGTAKMEGSGMAKNFNALAAASAALAADGRIKDAIFSSIAVNKNGSVSFALSATLDPKIIVFSP